MPSTLEQQIATIGHGDHLCAIYRDPEEQISYLALYLVHGLERGERCRCILTDSTAERLIADLEARGVRVQDEIARGSVQLFLPDRWKHPDGESPPHGFLLSLIDLVQEAIEAGYTGLRHAVEAICMLQAVNVQEQTARHEIDMSNSLVGRPATCLCMYDLNAFPSEAIEVVLRTHPKTIDRGRLHSNPFYEPPSMVEHTASRAERVDWMLQQLDRGQDLLDSLETTNQLLTREIEDHKLTQKRLRRQNRLLDLLSGMNERLFQIRSRQELYLEACRMAVEIGGFKLAWIGEFDKAISSVVPVARWGTDNGYLDALQPMLPSTPDVPLPTGITSRERAYRFWNGLEHTESMAPWQRAAIERGFRSLAGYPLVLGAKVVGMLTVYSSETDYFDDTGLQLLERVANDISLGLENLERTERQQFVLEALQRSEQRYRELSDTLPEVVFETDLSGKVTFVSGLGLARLGYSPEEIMEAPTILSFVTPEDQEKARANLHTTLSGLDTLPTEYTIRQKDGTLVPVMVYAKTSFSEGVPTGTRGVITDVSYQKAAQRALMESEERYRALFDGSSDAIFLVDPENGMMLDANQAATRIYGYSRDEMRSMSSADLVVKREAALKAIEARVPSMAKVFHRRRDGSIFPVEIAASSVVLQNRELRLASIRDISSRVEAEEAVRALEEMRKNIFAASPDIIIVTDLQGTIVDCNQAALDVYGVSDRNELLGRRAIDMIAPEERREAAESRMKLLSEGVARDIRHRVVRSDGSEIPVELTGNVIRDGNGQPIGIVGVIRDITERLAAMAEIRETSQALEAIVEASPLPILTLDLDGVVTRWNNSAERVFGWTAAEVTGKPLLIMPNNRWHELKGLLDAVTRGEITRGFETRRLRKDGSEIDVMIWTAPLIGADGEIKGMMSLLSDTTKQKQLQEQLLRAQRLETAGRIAGQVAHDFNNLLGPMAAYPELIKMGLPPGDRAIKLCDDMLLAAQTMADINTDLLALSRRGILSQTTVNLNDVVRQTLNGMKSDMGTVEVVIDLAEDLFPVKGSSSQLLRVVDNLVRNACDAMHGSGVLTVKTTNVYLDTAVGQYNRIAQGEYSRLAISDTGSGITPEVRDRIFDAFFTTKPTTGRRGSGLGLTVVESLVEDHHGYIDVESEPGIGATFSVYLPAHREVVQMDRTEPLGKGHETILVIDDDPLQRKVTQKILTALGYSVKIAESGEAAVAHVQEQQVDLLILDMVMEGGIDGVETYRRISQIRPGQRAMILSGFAETERVQEAQRLGAGPYVRKPVSIAKLASTVREGLSR